MDKLQDNDVNDSTKEELGTYRSTCLDWENHKSFLGGKAIGIFQMKMGLWSDGILLSNACTSETPEV